MAEQLIFDLDGTLVDVRRSYREVVRRTVQAYFARMLGLRGNEALVTTRDVMAFKVIGRFDSYWDLSAGMIRYIISFIEESPQDVPRPPEIDAADIYLRHAGAQVQEDLTDLHDRADFEAAAERIRDTGGGLQGLTGVVGELEHPLWFYEGDMFTANIITRLFQEFYLGTRHFPEVYEERPLFYTGAGLIEQERPLVPQHILAELRKRYERRLAIVTDRPMPEAQIAMESHQLHPFFKTVVAHEDVTSEEARLERLGTPASRNRPHPYSVLEAAIRLDFEGDYTAAYIGDTPDDIVTATRANEERHFASWGVLWGSDDPEGTRQELEAAGADRILEEPEELLQ